MINIERKLSVINGFVAIPDGQRLLSTKLTPLDVLDLIPGSSLIRLSPFSNMQEIMILDPTSLALNGSSRRLNRLFVRLPESDSLSGSPDWFSLLRMAAGMV